MKIKLDNIKPGMKIVTDYGKFGMVYHIGELYGYADYAAIWCVFADSEDKLQKYIDKGVIKKPVSEGGHLKFTHTSRVKELIQEEWDAEENYD